ncbi:putative ribonuclease H-like domain-containing protein [Tanacetum coccineum]
MERSHIAYSPNNRCDRLMLRQEIKHLFNQLLGRCWPQLKDYTMVRPLSGNALEKYGDFVCLSEIMKKFKYMESTMIKKLFLHDAGFLTFKLDEYWMAMRIENMLFHGEAAGYTVEASFECAVKYTYLKSHRLAECMFNIDEMLDEEALAGKGREMGLHLVHFTQRVAQTDSIPGKANVQCYNCNEKGHYTCECLKLKVSDAMYFKEQMLLAMKDEAGSNLTNEENVFMLDNSYAENVPSYDAKAISQVHASSKVHEQVSHGKRNTIIQTTNDDQIDSSIIFDDPFVENNGSMSEHDSYAHDEYHEIQMLAYNVQREAGNQKRVNDEFKKQKDLLQQELETFKNWAKTFEIKTLQCSKYK